MKDYRLEMLEQIKEVVNNLEESDAKRISFELDDVYQDETTIRIDIDLNKDYGLDYN